MYLPFFDYINIVQIKKRRGKNRINFAQFLKKIGKNLSKDLDAVFDDQIVESIARETGFVQRKSPMSGRKFLDLLMFNSQQSTQTSLQELTEDYELEHGLGITKQGLDKRFNTQAVAFLQKVLSNLLTSTVCSSQLITSNSPIKKCLVRDSTRYGLPHRYADKYKGNGGATKTKSMISIQYELDLLSGEQVDLQLTSGCRNDQQDSKESSLKIAKDTLLIRDLGYITTTFLKNVADQDAYYLNRLPSQMNIFNPDDFTEIELDKVYKKMKRYKMSFIEKEVFAGKKARIPCRIIIHLADDKTARHRIKKTTKQSKSIGCKVSAKQKIRSKLEIYMTNVTANTIKAENVKQIYSLRWQIELAFKSWKSICHIDKVKSVKIHRFECMLLAGLIWIITNWKFIQKINLWYAKSGTEHQCSHWKFFKYAARQKAMLRDILLKRKNISHMLETLITLAKNKFYKETKKGQKPYFQTLNLLINPC